MMIGFTFNKITRKASKTMILASFVEYGKDANI